MNPYAELRVDPGADSAAIRRAYRQRAKDTHPDHGGDAAAFHRAKHASVVLLDPARRAKFDATGEIDDDAPDNALAEVLVAVSQLLDAALVQCAQTGQDPAGVDLIALMGRLGAEVKSGMKQKRAEIERHLETSMRIERRFRRKVKSAEPDRVAMLIKHRIAAQRANLDMLTREAAKLDRALLLLREYAYDVDQRARPSAWLGDARLTYLVGRGY